MVHLPSSHLRDRAVFLTGLSAEEVREFVSVYLKRCGVPETENNAVRVLSGLADPKPRGSMGAMLSWWHFHRQDPVPASEILAALYFHDARSGQG